MKVLVINAGSSSLKYQLIDMDGETLIAKGNCERIGIDGKIGHTSVGGASIDVDKEMKTHKEAFLNVVEILTTGETKVIDSVSEISAVGHRILHGAEVYKESVLLTDEVLATLDTMTELGPLHIPPQLAAVRASIDVFGTEKPMVGVFDTSFHQTMPKKAYMFGLPYEYYEKYHIRRYGFHGTSHKFVMRRYYKTTEKAREGSKLIVCHLGNGSSLAAIKDGKVYDTSMGFTPLDGFLMGTRSGGIDPSVVTFIANKEGKTPDEMSDMMNKQSGVLGISGVSSDFRDLTKAKNEGNKRAELAIDMFVYQIKKFIGSYAAAMGGVDAICFTGGIGENDNRIRQAICEDFEFLGLKITSDLCKAANGQTAKFSTEDSKVDAYVIPTNEEIMIARDTVEKM